MIEIKNLKGEVIHQIHRAGRDDLINADLSNINLTNADLNNAKLNGAYLYNADLINANLSKAFLCDADLTNADLTNANLKGADLWDTMGNNREIKNLNGYTYKIVYTKDVIYIGCEGHSLKEWEAFTDDEIEELDGLEAMDFWDKYKNEVLAKIKADPTE